MFGTAGYTLCVCISSKFLSFSEQHEPDNSLCCTIGIYFRAEDQDKESDGRTERYSELATPNCPKPTFLPYLVSKQSKYIDNNNFTSYLSWLPIVQ